jgi:prepilin-type N-terminal cleavage/methylation domain-containing protein
MRKGNRWKMVQNGSGLEEQGKSDVNSGRRCNMLRSKKGFTLVELAIVLVIIGIILGAILKGQSLIQNAKAKKVQAQMKNMEAYAWTFFDRYGYAPGDCDRNGLINNALNTTSSELTELSTSTAAPTTFCTGGGGDADTFYSDLKYAKIIASTSPNRDLARHVFGDVCTAGYRNIGGVNYNAIACYNIPNWVAQLIDRNIDGAADSNDGRVRLANNAASYPTNNSQNVNILYFYDKAP